VSDNAAPPLRLRWLWIGGAVGLIGGLCVLSLLPAQEMPSLAVSDVVQHAAGYGVLMLWFAGLLARGRWLGIAFAFVVLGVGLEWLQGALGIGRVADPRDAAANALGVLLGLALAHLGLGGWMRWVEARVFPA
jgi:hypothetical protein